MHTAIKTLLGIVVYLACLQWVFASEAQEPIYYKETPMKSISFVVSTKHAKEIIEPQVEFHWTLDKHENKEVKERLTNYVHEHTRYILETYNIKPEDIKIGNTYIGTPTGLPDGMLFITDVKIWNGWRYQKTRVGFIIPDISGFGPEDTVYVIYNA